MWRYGVLLALSVSLCAALAADSSGAPANPVSPPLFDNGLSVTAPSVSAPEAPTLSTGDFVLSTGNDNQKTVSVTEETDANGNKSRQVDNSALTGKKSGVGSASGKTTTTSAVSPKTSASALAMLGLGSDNALLKALSGSDSDSSGIDALSSLLGGKSGSSSDSAALNKILSLLEKQEASTAKTSAPTESTTTGVTPASALAKTEKAETPHITSGGELVRLSVNGYSILPTVTTLVSSILARDGSFLITGDRRYLSSNRYRSETFYLLCRKTGRESYRLYADVNQDEKNTYSFLYQLARKSPIEGKLTGDLIVFRTKDTAWKLDCVIRVITPTVEGSSGR
jgi:hypothetical protein